MIAAVNSVIAFFYYFARRPGRCGSTSPPTDDRSPIASRRRSRSRSRSRVAVVVVVGIYPQLFARVGELAF